MNNPTPPRLARWWASVVLPREERDFFLGDLDEGFAARVSSQGLRAARQWYRREAFAAPIRSVTSSGTPGPQRGVWQDVRLALRHLARQPAYSGLAICALALGLAGSTAGFSVVNAVLLRPLPYPDPGQLVVIREFKRSDPTAGGISYLNFVDLQRGATSFSSMGLWTPTTATFDVAKGRTPEKVNGLAVSTNFLSGLGIGAVRGRIFDERDEPQHIAGGAQPIVLTYDGWQTWFGGRDDAIGQRILVDGSPAEVIGVTPPDDFLIDQTQRSFWSTTAVMGDANDRSSANGSRNFRMYRGAFARLRPDISRGQAVAELATVYAATAAQYPATFKDREIRLEPLREFFVSEAKSSVLLLLAIGAVVTLITAVNVSMLLLTRTSARHRELAIRTALGATRSRIIQQLVVEGLALASVGGAAGMVGALWLMKALSAWLPATLPRVGEFQPDWRVWAFALTSTLVVGLAAGLLSAFLVARRRGDTLSSTHLGGRATGGEVPRRLRQSLLVVEVAASTLLLVAAGLLIHSLHRLVTMQPGYEVANVMTISIAVDEPRFRESQTEPTVLNQFLRDLRQRVSALPGVVRVALAQSTPLSGDENSTQFTVVGRPKISGASASAQLRFVSDDYFETLAIPVERGRPFLPSDGPSTTQVMVVNETFAREFFGGEDAIGQRIVSGWGGDSAKTIVGIVGDVRHRSMGDPPRAEMYVPQTQFGNRRMTLVIKTDEAGEAIGAAIRKIVRDMSSSAAIGTPSLMADDRARTLSLPWLGAVVIGSCAGLAFLLTVVGLYGVTSYGAIQRTREIGVRVALGAQLGDVSRLLVGEGLRPVALGLVLGIAASLMATRVISAWVFDLNVIDPATYVAAPLLFGVVSAVACLIPALRIGRQDPLVALREGQDR